MFYLLLGLLGLACMYVGYANEKSSERAITEYLSREHDIVVKAVFWRDDYRVLYGGGGKKYVDRSYLNQVAMARKTYAIVASNSKSYKSNNISRRYN